MMLEQRAIGTFTSYELAENALRDLKQTGFLMHQVSLIGRDVNRHAEFTGVHTNSTITGVEDLNTGVKDAGAATQTGAAAGSALGGITGLLVGLGAIAIPGVGPVMLAGAAATAIATAISGTAIGAAAGSLAGGLTGMVIIWSWLKEQPQILPELRQSSIIIQFTNGMFTIYLAILCNQ
jgi:hypothetical protein